MNLTDVNVGSAEANDTLAASEAHPMHSLLEGSEGLDLIRPGEIREGTIARITSHEVLVDIGAKSEGVIDNREIDKLDAKAREALVVGAKVFVAVVQPEDENGNILLSLERAREEKDWRDALALMQNQEAYEGPIVGYNKGGLIVRVGNLRGFVPASQFSFSRRRLGGDATTPDQKWGRMVGEKMLVKVLEVDRERNRLILSERAASKESRDAHKERLLNEVKEGDILDGRVISIAEFGAFIDLGGADGLVHVSELTWKRIASPKDFLKPGQDVRVQVLGVDRDKKRIALSMKRLEQDPWVEMAEKAKVGQLVRGTVTKLVKFGAFARIEGFEDFEGLIHISELADERIDNPRKVVKEGQELTLRIVKIDAEKHRIGLSLKKVASAEYLASDWAEAEAAGAV